MLLGGIPQPPGNIAQKKEKKNRIARAQTDQHTTVAFNYFLLKVCTAKLVSDVMCTFEQSNQCGDKTIPHAG